MNLLKRLFLSSAVSALGQKTTTEKITEIIDEYNKADTPDEQRAIREHAQQMLEDDFRREQQERESMQFVIQPTFSNWGFDDYNVFPNSKPTPPMYSSKNISPYRVHVRRRKNKAARAARRRNRKRKCQTATSSPSRRHVTTPAPTL